MATQLFCPCRGAMNPSSPAGSGPTYMYGYCCSIKLQDPQQLVNFSLKFSYVASTSCKLLMLWLIWRKIRHKNFRWTDFGGYISRYTPRRYAPGQCLLLWPWLDGIF